ncbi:MAG: hypothetical protein ACFFD4_21575 [Candidatus Odinarchaeota archaeon]
MGEGNNNESGGKDAKIVQKSNAEVSRDIAEIEEIALRKHWLARFFTRSTKRRSILFALFISFGLYVLGFLSMAVYKEVDISAIDSLLSYIDLSTIDGRDLFFMPIFIFISIVLIVMINTSINEAIVVVPRIIPVPKEEIIKDLNKFRSNTRGIILVLPFILYDVTISALRFFVFPDGDITDTVFEQIDPFVFNALSDGIMINPVVHIILTFSWVFEWLIYGAVFNLLYQYLRLIYKYTTKKTYSENLLAVILKGLVDPLLKLGYTLSIYLGLFLLIRAIYIVVVGYYWSDLFGFLALLIFLPIVVIVPLVLIEHDLSKEQKELVNEYSQSYIEEGMKYIRDPRSITLDEKVNLLLQDKYITAIMSYKRETLKIYLRLFALMSVTAGSYLITYRADILRILGPLLQEIPIIGELLGLK